MQPRNKRRETWAGGALLRADSDDDDTDDLLPSIGGRSRHTGKPLSWQYLVPTFNFTFWAVAG